MKELSREYWKELPKPKKLKKYQKSIKNAEEIAFQRKFRDLLMNELSKALPKAIAGRYIGENKKKTKTNITRIADMI